MSEPFSVIGEELEFYSTGGELLATAFVERKDASILDLAQSEVTTLSGTMRVRFTAHGPKALKSTP